MEQQASVPLGHRNKLWVSDYHRLVEEVTKLVEEGVQSKVIAKRLGILPTYVSKLKRRHKITSPNHKKMKGKHEMSVLVDDCTWDYITERALALGMSKATVIRHLIEAGRNANRTP